MLVFAERSEGVGASEASRLIHRLSTGSETLSKAASEASLTPVL